MVININTHKEFIFGAIPDGNPEHAFTRMGLNDFWGNSNSTGVRIRFRTNSQAVKIQLKINYAEVEAFFGGMMVNGITYVVKNQQKVVKMECISGRNTEVQTIYNQNENIFLDYEIFCPVKNQLINLVLHIDDSAEITISDSLGEPILFLGGPTTFGRGCTFPHGTFSSITARKLSCDYYNLAVYNSKYLEEKFVVAAAKAISKPHFVVSEICSIPILKEYLEEKLERYMEVLTESFKNCLILFFSQPYYGTKRDNYIECNNIVKAFAKKHPEQKIMYLDGEFVFKGIPFDLTTLSSYLINDYGNMVLADRIIKIAEAYYGN